MLKYLHFFSGFDTISKTSCQLCLGIPGYCNIISFKFCEITTNILPKPQRKIRNIVKYKKRERHHKHIRPGRGGGKVFTKIKMFSDE